MMEMLFIKIVFGFYSICAIFVNGSPTIKDWELARGSRNSPKKKEARNLVPEFEDTEDEIIVKVGETVKMRCSVKNLGENVAIQRQSEEMIIKLEDRLTVNSNLEYES